VKLIEDIRSKKQKKKKTKKKKKKQKKKKKYRVGCDLASARSGRGLAIPFREDQGMSVGADASRLRPAVRRCRGFDTERRPAGDNGGAPFGYLDGAVQCASAL
jgi:hypothetical protein